MKTICKIENIYKIDRNWLKKMEIITFPTVRYAKITPVGELE